MDDKTIDLVILTDEDGNYYAIDSKVLDACRLPKELADEILALPADDNIGYGVRPH